LAKRLQVFRSQSSVYLRPFAGAGAFGVPAPRYNPVQRPLSFLLQSVSSFPWLRVHHYYGLICHLTPLGPVLASPLVQGYSPSGRDGIRLPQLSLLAWARSHPS